AEHRLAGRVARRGCRDGRAQILPHHGPRCRYRRTGRRDLAVHLQTMSKLRMNPMPSKRCVTLAASVSLALCSAADAVTISQVPLFISTGATPNVMLQIDDSGSMYTIMRAAAFDPAQTYPDWAPMI